MNLISRSGLPGSILAAKVTRARSGSDWPLGLEVRRAVDQRARSRPPSAARCSLGLMDEHRAQVAWRGAARSPAASPARRRAGRRRRRAAARWRPARTGDHDPQRLDRSARPRRRSRRSPAARTRPGGRCVTAHRLAGRRGPLDLAREGRRRAGRAPARGCAAGRSGRRTARRRPAAGSACRWSR